MVELITNKYNQEKIQIFDEPYFDLERYGMINPRVKIYSNVTVYEPIVYEPVEIPQYVIKELLDNCK